MVDKAREIALKILYRIEQEKSYSNIVLNEEIQKNRTKLNEKDIGLISEIVYGTTTWKLTIDEIIKKYSKIKLKKISTWILNILRMGIYQIIFLDKIPKSAAVNESVNLAKKYGHTSSSNFVNAILRKVDKKDYEEFENIENFVERISKQNSMPEWIIEELLKQNNNEKVEEICRNLTLKPNITIRINNLKTNKSELKDKLKEKGVIFEDTDLEDFLIIKNLKNIEKMDLFNEGYFTIQDESAGLTAKILDPKPNERVLDACSAPGGKTTYIAELMKNKGEIYAWDIYSHRLKLVEENYKRLGINIIKTEMKDAAIFDEKYFEKFDKILLDVPCLGIGVIKRKPDIKWTRKKEDIQKISEVQLDILKKCSNYLKDGGTLVYSTCSILEEENEKIIEKFLKENKKFKIEKTTGTNKYINIYPNRKQDGFFICKLIKNNILQ